MTPLITESNAPNLNDGLESAYKAVQIKDQLRRHYSNFSEEQVDTLLENHDNIHELEMEVIEELFGRSKAKLAGAKAKLGAHASNLKNRAATGLNNIGKKAGAYANNAANIGKQGLKALGGQYNTGDFEAGQIDPSTVGNDQPTLQDPNAAANSAKLQAILPELKKTLSTVFDKINGDLNALGLDNDTLNQVNPELAKDIRYVKGWLKSAYQKLG